MVKSKCWLITIIVIGLLFLIMLKAGNFLVINEKPQKSDVIIILSGGGIERLNRAVELYKRGYAPYLIISNGQEDNLYEAALIRGIPAHSIILENKASSTKENALYSKELMVSYNFTSAIVVSSNYHMRRVKRNYTKAISNSAIKLIYCSVPGNGYNPDRWWATREDRETTFIEYAKLIGNYFGFHGNDAKKVLNKIFSNN